MSVLAHVHINLREGDFDLMLVERIVDNLTSTREKRCSLLNEHPAYNDKVDAAGTKIGEGNTDRGIRFEEGATIGQDFIERSESVNHQGADLLHIAAVAYAQRYFCQLIGIVASEVFEVFVEELRVEEGNDGTIEGADLGALIGNAFHATTDTVALDKVTHAHTTCHQRNTIEEVFQKILHRKTHTRGQSCRNDSDARFRHLQQKECVEDVGTPNEDGNDVVGKGEVVLIGRELR